MNPIIKEFREKWDASQDDHSVTNRAYIEQFLLEKVEEARVKERNRTISECIDEIYQERWDVQNPDDEKRANNDLIDLCIQRLDKLSARHPKNEQL